MNLREQIAANIEQTLKDTKNDPFANNRLNKVVREPVVIEDLGRTSLPLVFVESSNEEREDISMGGSNITRQGSIEFNLNLYLQGHARDTQRNEIIALIETALDKDRTRGGLALDTQIIEIELLEIGESAPYASVRIVVLCEYIYKRGKL